MLSSKSGIVLEKCFICVVLNISFPFFEQTGMLAFSSPLVFAQQDHLPLKKNTEYVKWLVSIMPGWRSPVYLIIRRSSWRMVTLLPTRPNKLQLRRTDKISIFCCDARVQCCSRILSGEFHFSKSVLYMDHVGACLNCQFIVQFALY